MHKIGQIDQNCAMNCGIQGNGSNKSIKKSKNIFVVEIILKSIQRFARYRIGALILIGRLCVLIQTQHPGLIQLFLTTKRGVKGLRLRRGSSYLEGMKDNKFLTDEGSLQCSPG